MRESWRSRGSPPPPPPPQPRRRKRRMRKYHSLSLSLTLIRKQLCNARCAPLEATSVLTSVIPSRLMMTMRSWSGLECESLLSLYVHAWLLWWVIIQLIFAISFFACAFSTGIKSRGKHCNDHCHPIFISTATTMVYSKLWFGRGRRVLPWLSEVSTIWPIMIVMLFGAPPVNHRGT